MADFRILLYYAFAPVSDPASFAAEHFARCEELGLKGRVIVAEEGINGTVSGTTEACETYMAELAATPGFEDIEFKIDEADGHAFRRLTVKHRAEIVTLGVPLEVPVHERTGGYLEPDEWREMMRREDVVIVDGRNDYESDLGRFEGAICPPLGNFREFPEWLREHKPELDGKTILTYCTGGIRCEKLTAWMLQEGFSNVFQLHGGIVQYGKDPSTQGEGFEGVNVVFDDRVVASAGDRARPATSCCRCGAATINFVNCANVDCNKRLLMCESCEAESERTCDETCRSVSRKRAKGGKLSHAL